MSVKDMIGDGTTMSDQGMPPAKDLTAGRPLPGGAVLGGAERTPRPAFDPQRPPAEPLLKAPTPAKE